MAVTSQRPVIGPGSGVAFAFVAGKFLWSLDGSHEEILHALEQRAVPHEAARDGVWGWVTNNSHTQEPQYSVELYSDLFGVPQNQQHVQDCYNKLHAYLHQYTVVTPQAGQAITSAWKFSMEDLLSEPKYMLGEIVVARATGRTGIVRHIRLDSFTGGIRLYQVEFPGQPDNIEFREDQLDPDTSLWPDTLPWGDEEQDYYRTSSLAKFRLYGIDGKIYQFTGFVMAGTWEPAKMWHESQPIEAVFRDLEANRNMRMTSDEYEILYNQGSIVEVPGSGYGRTNDEWMTDKIHRSPEEATDLWPDTLPWKDDEQDWYRRSKIARATLYHASPKNRREAILTEGLHAHGEPNHDLTDETTFPKLHEQGYEWTDFNPRATYLWDRLEDAQRWYVPGGADIWQVDASGLNIHLDRVITSRPAYFTFDDIPPERLRLLGDGYQSPFESVGSWTREAADGTMGDMNPTGTLQSSLESSPAASAAYHALTQAGGQVYIVGGAVRDSMMGKDPKDIDMMCSGLDEDQMELALQGVGRLDFTGKAFGVFRLKVGGDEVEIAMPRSERSTGSGHKEFEVTTDPNLPVEADLSRRDFTWNAMAYDPSTRSLIDPHGGQNDLVNGRMALVNDKAFEDDPLRIVRAMVATARYGFEPDPSLLKSMSDNASSIRHLPGERIQMEFDKLLSAPNPVAAMELAENTGLLDYICPELSSTVGFDQQNPHHNLNVWDHTMAVLANMTRLSNDPDMRLAALFHDSGKPEAFWVDPNAPEGGGGHFYRKIQDDGTPIGHDHEDLGAQNVEAFLRRLRYPGASPDPRKPLTGRAARVQKLVQLHMFPYFKSLKGARKFLQAAGDEKTAFDLLTFREADSGGKDGITPKTFDDNMLSKGRDLLQQVLEASHAVSVKDLDISGKDLIDIGFKPGPEIGQTLNNLLDLVMEDPSLNEKDKLLQKVRELR